jgi:hypothetical protein
MMREPSPFKTAEDAGPHASGAAREAKSGKPPKDCSEKHTKVDLLEQESKQADARTHEAKKADAAAYKEYLIWANDPVKGPKYYQHYLLAYEAHLEAYSKGADVTKKLNLAKAAAHRCEAQAYSG